ncbi:hypothetical protein A3Q56_02567 [Intoshia linei]|uniref:Vacuolar ATPase assembly integral membrane protein VMA21 homolog n=1 Tax=Intoshia linei TaxID=1819745 RepID=A0A177B7P5_9BILA|nr:hypothetical protein A3Q56_02567 [Intoshia linei]
MADNECIKDLMQREIENTVNTPLKKLAISSMISIFVLPIVCFFIFKKIFFDFLHMDPHSTNTVSAIGAVIIMHCMVGWCCYSAWKITGKVKTDKQD